MTTLDVQNVTRVYKVRGKGSFEAVSDVSFRLESGRTIALVGQSGSGKSTLAKMIMQLERPTAGTIELNGKPIPSHGRALRDYRQQIRMVFQDPFASLNPYHTIRHHLTRPLLISHQATSQNVNEAAAGLLDRVRLSPAYEFMDRRPHELSGGQRQRVAIARALASKPAILVADEPVSMLDVSIRLEVLNLLADLQVQDDLGVLYITHDLATARHFSDELMVMHDGRIVERGDADEVILHPKDEYTRRLRDASPDPEAFFRDQEKRVAKGGTRK